MILSFKKRNQSKNGNSEQQSFSSPAAESAPTSLQLNFEINPQNPTVIFDDFIRMLFHDFIQLYKCQNVSGYCNYPFQNQIQYHQTISFTQNKILLKAYSIQSGSRWFPITWKVECLNESEHCILINQREEVKELQEPRKLICFTLQRKVLCSTLRFICLKNSDERGIAIFSSFDLFGKIINNNTISLFSSQSQKR
jgi:hypothetical protein